jgi:hypothetical protein
MRPRFALALVLALLAVAVIQAAPIRVLPQARDGSVLVTFELADAFTEDVQQAIHSGLNVTFLYDVELRRGVPFWIDRTVGSSTVGATVQYDNLTRRHQLSRTIDGRTEPDSMVTEDADQVRRWLTSFERLPLFTTATLEPNSEYYIRVRARTRPRTAGFWPWSGGVSGDAKFTFIP